MPDGSVLKGAQGNFPVERVLSVSLRALAKQGTGDMMVAQFLKPMLRSFYAAPWITPDPYERWPGCPWRNWSPRGPRFPPES